MIWNWRAWAFNAVCFDADGEKDLRRLLTKVDRPAPEFPQISCHADLFDWFAAAYPPCVHPGGPVDRAEFTSLVCPAVRTTSRRVIGTSSRPWICGASASAQLSQLRPADSSRLQGQACLHV